MDILFSAYGSGPLPKTAMEEIERRTEELLKSGTFNHLEKKSKLDQLQETYPPSVPYSATSQGSLPSLQLPRVDSPSTEHSNPMLSPATRGVTLQSLSITIPQSPDSQSPWDGTGEEDSGSETPTNPVSPHKQVKFLAPGIDDEAMSDQSSICQSPSWENYGQRKKEKKLEAERRKKEKLQAEKEAKTSKKRNTTRLSKLPPSVTVLGAGSRTSGFISPERSMSDPSLITQHSLLHPKSVQRPEGGGKAASTDNLQRREHHLLTSSGVPSGSNAIRPYTVTQNVISKNSSDSHLELRRSISEGPVPNVPAIPPSLSSYNDGRLPRDMWPPSASRTPMLRHMSPSGHTRSNSLPQTTTSHPRGQGGHRNGDMHFDNCVQGQRAQSNDLTLAELVDDTSSANSKPQPSSRSSSRNPRHSRRSSFTQDAKVAAMKLIGRRGTSATRNNPAVDNRLPSIQGDYFGNASHLHALGSIPVEVQGNLARGPPSTSYSTGSSGGFSATDSISASQTKRSRSLKDAAKAALSLGKRPQLQPSATALSTSAPYFSFRDRKQSKASVFKDIGGQHGHDGSSKVSLTVRSPDLQSAPKFRHADMKQSPGAQPAAPDSVSSNGTASQTGDRVSEGSSTSSAFEDGSSLVSPTITPDTSRPQSSGGDSALDNISARRGPSFQALECAHSSRSSKSTTPRPENPEEFGPKSIADDDRWSRVAMPVDQDNDAQSFITSRSNFDDSDAPSPTSPTSPINSVEVLLEDRTEGLKSQQDLARTLQSSGGHSSPTYSDLLPAPSGEPVILVPPRSKRRDTSVSGLGQPSIYAEKTTEISSVRYGSAEDLVTRPLKPERATRKQKRELRTREFGSNQQSVFHGNENFTEAPPLHSSTDFASPPLPPRSGTRRSKPVVATEFQIPSSPYSEGFLGGDTLFTPDTYVDPSFHTGTGSTQHDASRPSPQPRTHSAPVLSPATISAPRTHTPSPLASPGAQQAGSGSKPGPVSILKPPKHSDISLSAPTSPGQPPILSSLPRHMQPKPGITSRTPSNVAEARMAPIAKMFVECCSCKFYHDMPSKIYECMAKPDAVVEDRNLGISGAITTAVKCPWCQHSMSTGCCAGYAAVVYLKEKLH
ncbi:hypothetical protein QBC36DRAFT_188235 [Triangularia setosa]|uniref:Uncharacterized protein n=1 Tax=Triangularia setosa TaxID=2587417 RepID=A0AAN6W9Q1_9PEZI|nr:hypothetical protein QBC36DRAFT_188235 [Podospora setosa]